MKSESFGIHLLSIAADLSGAKMQEGANLLIGSANKYRRGRMRTCDALHKSLCHDKAACECGQSKLAICAGFIHICCDLNSQEAAARKSAEIPHYSAWKPQNQIAQCRAHSESRLSVQKVGLEISGEAGPESFPARE